MAGTNSGDLLMQGQRPDMYSPFLDNAGSLKPIIYQVTPFDLSVAHTGYEFEATGTFFAVIQITSGASFQASFNESKNTLITFDSVQQIKIPFTKVYITNTAQPAGSICYIFTAIGGEYTPYYVQKTVAPTLSTVYHGTQTVNATAVLLTNGGSNPLRRTVVIMNNSSSAILYVGTSNAVTAANGLPVLYGGERHFVTPFWTGDIYLISDTAGTDVRYWIGLE